MKRKVKVIQDSEAEVPLDILAQSIIDIEKGIRKLRAGPLNDKALTLLIQHAAPWKTNSARYSIMDIQNILTGIESLAKTYLKKPGGKK